MALLQKRGATGCAGRAAALLALARCALGSGVSPKTGAASTSTLPPATTTTGTTIPLRYRGTAGSPRTLNPFLDGPDVAVLDLIEVTAATRSGARWADGIPITDDDLAFTIEIASVRDEVGAAWWGTELARIRLNPFAGLAWNVASGRRHGTGH